MKLTRGVDGSMKFCPGCQKVYFGDKVIYGAFRRDTSRSDGLQAYCTVCRSEGVGRGKRK